MQLWKNTALTSVAALLGLFLLPLAVAREPAEVPEYTELPRTEQTAPVQPAVKAVYDADRTLRVLDGETVREMTLADYLVGVTAAEMPASFAEEALKAQAVAARTYTLYKLTAGRTTGTRRTSARTPPAVRRISPWSRPGPTGGHRRTLMRKRSVMR